MFTEVSKTQIKYSSSANEPCPSQEYQPVNVCMVLLSPDLRGATPVIVKPQRSLPGTPVSGKQPPIDLRTSMDGKYKEIAEVRRLNLRVS